MAHQIFILLLLCFSLHGYCQEDLHVYDVSKTTLVGPEPSIRRFPFTNGRLLIVSFFPDPDDVSNDVISEFTLYEYGQDTALRFYDVMEPCKVSFSNDTLFIERIEPMPVSRDHGFVDTTWLTEKWFYDKDSKLTQTDILAPWFSCNDGFINATLSEYHSASWTTQVDEAYGEQMMNLAARLMLISGCQNGKYEAYFKDFKRRFKPDGAYAEWYDTMAVMVETAKQLQKQ